MYDEMPSGFGHEKIATYVNLLWTICWEYYRRSNASTI